MIKKILFTLLSALFIGIFGISSAVTLHLPKDTTGDPDYNINGKEAYNEQDEGSHSYLDVIALVNKYLWFAIGFVCFLSMIWNGYQLIIARGDEKQMKSASNALIGCGVGIAVCLLAYIIVKFAIGLF